MSQPMLSKLTHTSLEIKGLCYHHPAKPRVCDPSKTVTRRQSQENQELEAICGYIASSRPTWGKRHYLPPPKQKTSSHFAHDLPQILSPFRFYYWIIALNS